MKVFIYYLFLFFCLFFGVSSYLNIDPLKRSFFLIFSILTAVFFLANSQFFWYSYFVCLLFLRGVFVIVVYFSRLSKLSFSKFYGGFTVFIISFLFLNFSFLNNRGRVGLSYFYDKSFLFLFCFIILYLLWFLGFRRYLLNFSGALRKV